MRDFSYLRLLGDFVYHRVDDTKEDALKKGRTRCGLAYTSAQISEWWPHLTSQPAYQCLHCFPA